MFMGHLAIGDTWNYINNVEKRTGVAVPGVVACASGVYAVTAVYFTVSPTAGAAALPGSQSGGREAIRPQVRGQPARGCLPAAIPLSAVRCSLSAVRCPLSAVLKSGDDGVRATPLVPYLGLNSGTISAAPLMAESPRSIWWQGGCFSPLACGSPWRGISCTASGG